MNQHDSVNTQLWCTVLCQDTCISAHAHTYAHAHINCMHAHWLLAFWLPVKIRPILQVRPILRVNLTWSLVAKLSAEFFEYWVYVSRCLNFNKKKWDSNRWLWLVYSPSHSTVKPLTCFLIIFEENELHVQSTKITWSLKKSKHLSVKHWQKYTPK